MEDCLHQNEDTKTRLLQAAGATFAQHGFRDATIRDICRDAGAHVGAVNYHFRDKEGLYEAVFAYSLQSAIEKYPPDLGLGKDATPEEKLRAFIGSFLLRMMGEGFPAWHGKLMAQEIANPTGLMKQLIKNSVRPLMVYLYGIIKELIKEKNETPPEENHEIFICAMSIIGQCLHHFKGKHIIEAICPKGFDPGDIEGITDHITRFSLGGIQVIINERDPSQ